MGWQCGVELGGIGCCGCEEGPGVELVGGTEKRRTALVFHLG